MTATQEANDILATRGLRRGLALLKEAGYFGSLLDVGCGHFGWFSTFDPEGLSYTGIDIDREAIEKNTRLWGSESCRFEMADIVTTVPKAHDFVLCRNLFNLLAPGDAARAFNNIKKSGSRYFAATHTIPELIKTPVAPTGSGRPIDWQSEPFSFPPPVLVPENRPGETLAVWRLDELPYLDVKEVETPPVHHPLSPEDFARYGFFRTLCDMPFVDTIWLFGSRSKGNHRTNSDIDLMILCDDTVTPVQWAAVCDSVINADCPLDIDCMRFDDTIQTVLYKLKAGTPLCFTTLYARGAFDPRKA